MQPKLYKILFVILCLCLSDWLPAQPPHTQARGGSGFTSQNTGCLSETQRSSLINSLKKNTAQLAREGKLPPVVTSVLPTIKFIWPVAAETEGFNEPGYYAITNHVDQDTRSNSVLDYNCGTRTYDGHKGIDVITWPFAWAKMDADAVKIISAAEGVIIGKWDGYYDKECTTCTSCAWNGVYVRNTDGSICIYGHLKTGSLTAKQTGDAVKAGEYLGILGSSGSSTTPHLHFEVYEDDSYTHLVDPWEGNCNSGAHASIWEKQQAYTEPHINQIATHHSAPEPGTCYGTEHPNFSDVFYPGGMLYYAIYLKDQMPNTSGVCTILQPDGKVFNQFTQSFTEYFAASYWYWNLPLPSNAPAGTWTFKFEYNGQTVTHPFVVSGVLPLQLINFSAMRLRNSTVQLNWQTINEVNVLSIEVERSSDAVEFSEIGSLAPAGNGSSTTTYYTYTDGNPLTANNFYRLKITDKEGHFFYSNIVSAAAESSNHSIVILGNPAGSTLQFITNTPTGKGIIKIVNAEGKRVLQTNQSLQNSSQVSLPVAHLAPGVYYLMIEVANSQFTKPFIKK